MKQHLTLLLLLFSFITSTQAQNLQADTTKAHEYFKLADSLLIYQADYEQSITYFNKAAEIYKKTEMWQKHFRSRLMVARNLRFLERYDEALKIGDLVKNESIIKLGENNSEEVFSYFIKGEVFCWGLSEYEKALSLLTTDHFNKNNLTSNDSIDYTHYYNLIGSLFFFKNNFYNAINYFLLSLKINKKNYGESHPLTGLAYNNLSATYGSIEMNNKALDYAYKTLEIYKIVLGRNHPNLVLVYNKLGWINIELGNNNEAIKYLNKALELTIKINGKYNMRIKGKFH